MYPNIKFELCFDESYKETNSNMEFETIISLMVEKGYLSEETMETVLSDGDFQKEKCGGKKTTDERRGKYDVNKCQARVWEEGYDNIQCDCTKLPGGSLCTDHQTCSDKDGGWWLGILKEPRPEKPTWRGVEHFWRKEGVGNDIVEKEKELVDGSPLPEKKKKRGRPVGSKNKKKKNSEKKDLTIEEITLLLEQKKKEVEEEDMKSVEKKVEVNVDGDCMKYIVDGVPYEITGTDIMDPEDFSVIGVADGKGGINFVGEEEEEKHLENVEKYDL